VSIENAGGRQERSDPEADCGATVASCIRGERMLHDIQGAERVALARDICAYAHFPMIVGIVLFAFAMKTIVGHVDEQLDSVTAFALCGGCALYLLTYSAIRTRVERRVTVSRGRFVAALVLLLCSPLRP
jgi:low temperature requirement protein LtrA